MSVACEMAVCRKGTVMKELVQKAKNGDKDAFATLIHAHTQGLYKVALAYLKNDDDAADAIQETILACWENIAKLKKDELFKTWLTRILINNCNAIYRHRKTYRLDMALPETSGNEAQFDTVEWMQMLEGLDKKYRDVLILHYAQGLRVREIAQVLGIGESAVKKRLVTARRKMEAVYTDRRELNAI